MPKASQRLQQAPGVEQGLLSRQWSDSGHDWLDKRTDASVYDANVAQGHRQRLLKQLGETSWLNEHQVGGKERETAVPEGRVQHLYRGMSEGEFQEAKGRGYIQSDQRGVIDVGWEGTNASTDPASAHSYMPRQGSGRIVKMAYKPEDQWFGSNVDSYARTRQQIPWDRVVAHTEEFTHPGSSTAPKTMRDLVREDEKV